MAPWHRNNPSGHVYLIVLGVAVFFSIACCWAIHQAFQTIIEALP